MKTLLIACVTALFCSACQKDYQCVCLANGTTTSSFKITDTKKKAEQQCNQYYQENFGSIPWNETNCSIR